ncbi:leucine-rich repeat protein [Flavobacterium sp. PLA-1-15]|uniref:leucine-rich repeat protein n=1 Tax=Flavobacterium sp. PLA-1-15 TaxID=3380533 RepID=UPI003B7CB1E0
MIAKKHIYGKRPVPPNTFIGGVGSTLSTKNLLAAKLGIAPTRIKSFRIVNDEVQACIQGNYNLANLLFGNFADPIAANLNITHYFDNDNLVKAIGTYCFANCINFSDFKFLGLNRLDNRAFFNTGVVHANLYTLPATTLGEPHGWFQNCSKLKTANLGNFTSNNFVNCFNKCTSLETVVMKSKFYGSDTLTNVGIIDFENEFVEILSDYSMRQNSRFQKIVVNNCIQIGESVLYKNSNTEGQYNWLKEFIGPKVVSIGNSAFRNNTDLNLVDIRACKVLGTSVFLNALRLGTILKVHIFLATSNAGSPDANLTYAKNNRNAIVEFYDDNGNYVSTL